jgi:hypothetical protein
MLYRTTVCEAKKNLFCDLERGSGPLASSHCTPAVPESVALVFDQVLKQRLGSTRLY